MSELKYPKPPVVRPPALFVSVDDAIAMISVGRSKLYDLMEAGLVVGRKVGTRTLVSTESLGTLQDKLPPFRTNTYARFKSRGANKPRRRGPQTASHSAHKSGLGNRCLILATCPHGHRLAI